jgi:hypothetical protein
MRLPNFPVVALIVLVGFAAAGWPLQAGPVTQVGGTSGPAAITYAPLTPAADIEIDAGIPAKFAMEVMAPLVASPSGPPTGPVPPPDPVPEPGTRTMIIPALALIGLAAVRSGHRTRG